MDFPAVDDLTRVPTGDMPGDSVQVSEAHLAKARTVFPVLWDLLEPVLAAGPHHRAVVAVHGGSGVGKSEIGSLLAYGLNQLGVGAYVLSGDNYPHRVPSANDAERLRTFRAAGARALVDAGLYDAAVRAELAELRAADQDADAGAGHRAPVVGHVHRRGPDGAGGVPRQLERDRLRRAQRHPHGVP